MNNTILSSKLIEIILKAQQADENGLRALRKKIIAAVNIFGARKFVTVTAEVLKNNFQIEGCNDARLTLKRIFNISLEELEKNLLSQKYNLPHEHPLSILSADHKDNIKRLKALRISLGKLNLNKDTSVEQLREKAKQVKDYYTELDSHITKEEDVLFPILEANGMQEHPQNLKEEHKNFREILSKINDGVKDLIPENLKVEEIANLKEKFVSDISNHIFRETYIFYPAALEFIKEKGQWENIKKGFDSIKANL